nr:hypothetical protein CFP56_40949 [Quercus suber]
MSLLLQYQLGEMMVGLKLWMVKYLANFSSFFSLPRAREFLKSVFHVFTRWEKNHLSQPRMQLDKSASYHPHGKTS